jgi:hypothetical protein
VSLVSVTIECLITRTNEKEKQAIQAQELK